jgi:hypothetical protein
MGGWIEDPRASKQRVPEGTLLQRDADNDAYTCCCANGTLCQCTVPLHCARASSQCAVPVPWGNEFGALLQRVQCSVGPCCLACWACVSIPFFLVCCCVICRDTPTSISHQVPAGGFNAKSGRPCWSRRELNIAYILTSVE